MGPFFKKEEFEKILAKKIFKKKTQSLFGTQKNQRENFQNFKLKILLLI